MVNYVDAFPVVSDKYGGESPGGIFSHICVSDGFVVFDHGEGYLLSFRHRLKQLKMLFVLCTMLFSKMNPCESGEEVCSQSCGRGGAVLAVFVECFLFFDLMTFITNLCKGALV